MKTAGRSRSNKMLCTRLSTLTSTTRIKILETLDEKGHLSFTELSKAIGTNGPALVYHLSKLLKAEMIVKKVSEDPFSPSYRMYAISEAGKETFHKLVYA
jgi:DNA-binding transcriptional ArsR family regulator